MANPVANSIPLTGDPLKDGLLQGSSWTFGGGPRTLTYSFNVNFEYNEFNEPTPGEGGTWADNPAMANAVVRAMAAWSQVANIGFTLSPSGHYIFESTADIAFGLTGSDLTGIGALALAFFPDPTYATDLIGDAGYTRNLYPRPEGDVLLDNFDPSFSRLADGGDGFWTILHELGHALGLKHPFDDGGNNRPTLSALGAGQYDQERYTVMSYSIVGGAGGGRAATPMPLDILAIQHIYGANMAYRTGDDTYVAALDGVMRTQWDAGGTDTIDASSIAHNLTLDLRPGTVMDLGNGTVLGIAYHCDIENVSGGAGNDTLYGNTLDNLLAGNGGSNIAFGGAGNDTYIVTSSSDQIRELAGEGDDTVLSSVSFSAAQAAFEQSLENITLTGSGNIAASGNAATRRITGNSGNNAIDDGMGPATMAGAAGDDSYAVHGVASHIVEEVDGGNDSVALWLTGTYTLPAQVENLTLHSSDPGARSTLVGNAQANVITGAVGDDEIDGGAGTDTLNGGAGNDTYTVDDGGDLILEDSAAGIDAVRATIDYLLPSHLENLMLLGNSPLHGTGNGAANRIHGNAGNNLLDGGLGADTLIGGWGNDQYVVEDGLDVVAETAPSATLVSTATDGSPANAVISNAKVSADGLVLVFQSFASNLVPGFGTWQHVFVKNLQSGAIVAATSAADGTPANSFSLLSGLSADGRYVVFESQADNLVPGDTNGASDLFRKDIQTGAIARISTDAAGAQVSGIHGGASVSADGRFIAFASTSDALVAGDTHGPGQADVFVKDMASGVVQLVSTETSGNQVGAQLASTGLSADGRYVVFSSTAGFTAGDTNQAADLFRKDLATGALSIASAAADGTPASLLGNPVFLQLNGSSLGGLSADGRYVAFSSVADNLVAGDTSGGVDTFVKDLLTGVVWRTSTTATGAQSTGGSNGTAISGNGRYALVNSIAADLAPGDTDTDFDVFVKDLQTGQIALVSAPAQGPKQGGLSLGYSLSEDGSLIVIASSASNLDTGGKDSSHGILVVYNPLVDPGGEDSVQSSVDFSLPALVENLYLTGTASLTGIGNPLANYLQGNAGTTNYLVGGAGADTMAGGDGNDVYYVDESGDVVIETNALPAGGTDTVVSTVTYSAGSHIENILFTGAAGTTGIGNSLANYIEGNAAQNYLFGGAGTDTLKGNDGNDIYYVDASTDVVIETNALAAGGTDTVVSSVTYQLGANLEQLLLSGSAAITGIGNAGANYIEGNSAQNYLSGGAGSDTLKGNDGNDVYYVDVSTDVVIETNADTVSGGVDFVVSTVTYQLGANVENLLLSGTDPITGIGSAVNNYIEGNNAANFLSGGLGADTMKGNDGNDVYYVDNTGDVVIETNAVLGTGGRDTVSSSIAYALGANVEDLLLTGNAAIGGLGNGLANYMTGNTAANALSGQDGNDTLVGGTGTDTLTGGLGADTFDFNTLLNSLVGASRDVITDFSNAQGDRVDLAGIDANTLLANDQAFSFIGAATFSLVAGQLRLAGNILAGDTDGNGVADFEVQLTGVAALSGSDLIS